VLLTKAFASGASALLLNEPTNRLDVYALEALKKALGEFTSAVVRFG